MTKYANDRQRCKVKVRKFLFNISWHFEVMEENLRGADSPPPGMDRVKLFKDGGGKTGQGRILLLPGKIGLNNVNFNGNIRIKGK